MGATSDDMGPYSQANTVATKSVVDMGLCQQLTFDIFGNGGRLGSLGRHHSRVGAPLNHKNYFISVS